MTEFPTAPKGSVYAEVFEALERIGVEYAGSTDKGGLFTCPVHEDDKASFAVDVGRTGKPLYYCFPCCGDGTDKERISDFQRELRERGLPFGAGDAIGVDWGDPAPTYERSGGSGRVVRGRPAAIYYYDLPDGAHNIKVERYEAETEGGRSKSFAIFRWDEQAARWVSGLRAETVRTPYKYHRFPFWAERGEVLWLVEGEKTVDALIGQRMAATTFPSGTNAPLAEGWEAWFAGFEVRVWPDADEVGVKRAVMLGKALKAAGVDVSVWGVPAEHVQPTDDAYDVIERGDLDLLRRLKRPDWEALAALKPSAVTSKRPKPEREHVADPDAWVAAKYPVSVLSGVTSSAVRARPTGPYACLASAEPLTFASELIERHLRDDNGALTLRFGHEDNLWWHWAPGRNHFVPLSEVEVRALITRRLRGAQETSPDGKVRPVKVTSRLQMEVVRMLQVLLLTSEHGAGALLPATGGVPFRNGWLDVSTGALAPLGPERDVRWALETDYSASAECPEWFAFLDTLGFGKGTEEHRLLAQWLGYLLSGSKRLDRALLLIGPPRSGKGTIIRVAERLFGYGHAATSLEALTENFGLQNLIGKGLATIGDARFGRSDKALNARLLSLTSASDSLPVDVKYGQPRTLNLPARFMIGTNEAPSFIEASDALAERFLVLQFNRSFLGKEDLGLFARLEGELAGIARWALDGLADLETVGRFSETKSGRALNHQIALDAAPVRMFLEAECEVGEGYGIEKQALFDAYLFWARRNNEYEMRGSQFWKDLRAIAGEEILVGKKRIGGKLIPYVRGVRML